MATPEQREENRRKWIEALRSGKYEQGNHALYENGKYCCLGVACEVLYGPSDDGVWFDRCGFAPDELVHDLGLYGVDGPTRGARVSGWLSLTAANDVGATFEEIADFIEQHPDAIYRADEKPEGDQ